jgi:molybdopterin biosynthesis enzyme
VVCAEVTPLDWQGSGDVPTLCRANAFLVADAGQAEYKQNEPIPVLLK